MTYSIPPAGIPSVAQPLFHEYAFHPTNTVTNIPTSTRSRTGAQARTMRALNLTLVLNHILTDSGQATRSSIAQLTGITASTVSRLVDEMVACGLIDEVPPPADNSRGRPAMRLRPAKGKAVALGLEINVSGIDARLIDLAGYVIAEETRIGDYAQSDPQTTMNELAEIAHHIVHTHVTSSMFFVGSGLALPGLISHDSLTYAPNLGWQDIPFSELLSPIADLHPRVIGNEADLAAFAISFPTPGVATGPSSFIYISGEVGVGGGVVVEHRSMSGAHGWSGEIGHVCVDPMGALCSCGAHGCLETFLGLRALSASAGLESNASVADVIAAAHNGSLRANSALRDAGTALGRALAATINVVDIPLVLLGGNIGELADEITEPALTEMRTRILQSSWCEPTVHSVPDSTWLAVTGAAHMVLQHLVNNPLEWTDPLPQD
ncbi:MULTISPECIES: ROK family transcriptional regulator [unclassified Schaalia]|uniref:ROK family transcriptional regulator n=1 Tax=unclassified Schaalia TaxID=2691889 RepID=UPI001E3C5F32|nr:MULTISPECIES: ROK family transcriptional regulator [unclassified Schaalia]MCD4550067.1 ROK family protein [Schaalia sp. lx-260]MCD4557866.1 ROK family protein [Schaalia sp. lx-100]